jgi:hydroxymethylpyrimidine/phosphomethylpyrimidine kinase
MQFNRPIAMSIAGMDPCGGAGLLADVKTFEQHKVYGLAVTTAQTVQTENTFFTIKWEKKEHIVEAIKKMLVNYQVVSVKIGIIQDLQSLDQIVSAINTTNKRIKIIVDPVIRSTTEFNFWNMDIDESCLYQTLGKLELITPNHNEIVQLSKSTDARQAAKELAQYCNVLLKGGHNKEEPGVDYLYTKTGVFRLPPDPLQVFPKHGSGCVLSSSIASHLALGTDLITACKKAKNYTEKFLSSNHSLLGYHVR